MKLQIHFKSILVLFGLMVVLAVCLAGSRGLPPSEGIINFGRVNESLFRGAQPDVLAVKHLQTLGVKSIINLRVPEEASKREEKTARNIGLVYTNMPLAGLGMPTDEQVARILSLIDTLPKPVYVHCKHGCDRTGTIIACYRISHDHWAADEALSEASKYGLSVFERGMREYVVNFGRTTNTKTNQTPIATR